MRYLKDDCSDRLGDFDGDDVATVLERIRSASSSSTSPKSDVMPLATSPSALLRQPDAVVQPSVDFNRRRRRYSGSTATTTTSSAGVRQTLNKPRPDFRPAAPSETAATVRCSVVDVVGRTTPTPLVAVGAESSSSPRFVLFRRRVPSTCDRLRRLLRSGLADADVEVNCVDGGGGGTDSVDDDDDGRRRDADVYGITTAEKENDWEDEEEEEASYHDDEMENTVVSTGSDVPDDSRQRKSSADAVSIATSWQQRSRRRVTRRRSAELATTTTTISDDTAAADDDDGAAAVWRRQRSKQRRTPLTSDFSAVGDDGGSSSGGDELLAASGDDRRPDDYGDEETATEADAWSGDGDGPAFGSGSGHVGNVVGDTMDLRTRQNRSTASSHDEGEAHGGGGGGDSGDRHGDKYAYAGKLQQIAHALHYCSVGILGLFVLQVGRCVRICIALNDDLFV